MKRSSKPWGGLFQLARFSTGDKLAKFLISKTLKNFKYPISTEWSVDGKLELSINGMAVGSAVPGGGGLGHKELKALAKIIRVLESEWIIFWDTLGHAIRPWLFKKADWLDSNSRIAKEVETAFKHAQKSLAKAKRKIPN